MFFSRAICKYTDSTKNTHIVSVPLCLNCLSIEIESHCKAQASLELGSLLPQPPKS